MGYNIKLNELQLENIINDFNFIIGSIDRVGSGFYGKEETALALLLCFRENEILDKLSSIRHVLHIEMENQLSEEENDEFIEKESDNVWKPPYNATKEELLKMLEKI